MTQCRVIPKGGDTSVMNFMADKVVLNEAGWSCEREGKFAGYAWAGYAQLYSADASKREVAPVVVPK